MNKLVVVISTDYKNNDPLPEYLGHFLSNLPEIEIFHKVAFGNPAEKAEYYLHRLIYNRVHAIIISIRKTCVNFHNFLTHKHSYQAESIHFAGIGDIAPSIETPTKYIDVNVQSTVCISEVARCAGVPKLVYAASCH